MHKRMNSVHKYVLLWWLLYMCVFLIMTCLSGIWTLKAWSLYLRGAQSVMSKASPDQSILRYCLFWTTKPDLGW